jgi:hypothetical protein
VFRVVRNPIVPQSLLSANPSYQTQEVVKELQKMFHGKCYLCEKGNVDTVEVEHLIPHKDDSTLKYDWNNLFYSCRRCNSIKSTRPNIVDITKYDVDRLIELQPPDSDTGDVKVVGHNDNSFDLSSTLQLLNDCYNDARTSYREISKTELLRDIMYYQTIFLQLRFDLLHPSRPLTKSQKDELLESISAMCKDNYPYSAFWKWAVFKDSRLKYLIGIWN